jgi:archaellum component FlaC
MKKVLLIILSLGVCVLSANNEAKKAYSQNEALVILNETVKKLVIDNKTLKSDINRINSSLEKSSSKELEKKIEELEKLVKNSTSSQSQMSDSKQIILDKEILEYIDEKN